MKEHPLPAEIGPSSDADTINESWFEDYQENSLKKTDIGAGSKAELPRSTLFWIQPLS
jgi:hypothetical protein